MAKKVTLAMIAAAGAAGMFVPLDVAQKFAADGSCEFNEEIKNEAGEVAIRALVVSDEDAVGVVAQKNGKTAFVIEDSVAIPTVRRGRSGTEKYPFAQLEVGQSFFVAATEEMPEPAKALASTVSGATARYAVASETETKTNRKGEVVPVMVATRKFIIRAVEGGARIWRSE